MNFLDKLKNMFTEEVEIEEPIKKDVIQVEIPAPLVKKEVLEEIESKPVVKEEKVQSPVFFDDKDFSDLEKTNNKKVAETPKREVKSAYGVSKIVNEPKKNFKPTPIISPVYGVLDKNYHKEDIVNKSTKQVAYVASDITVDDIRRKAYGTLEDELENTLTKTLFYSEKVEKQVIPTDLDVFDELEAKIQKEKAKKEDSFELLDEINNILDENPLEDDLIEEMNNDDKLSEGDLFGLIDSMYEKGDGDDD